MWKRRWPRRPEYVVVSGLVAALAVAGRPAPALAVDFAPAAPAAPAAPDVVMLKSGGLLRGTIAELVPGERVVIVLVTGEKRTVSMSEVTYAGPAAGAPNAAPPSSAATFPSDEAPKRGAPKGPEAPLAAQSVPPSAAPESTVHFESTEPGRQIFVMTDTLTADVNRGWGSLSIDRYRPLCVTPCSAALPPGTYRFGVGENLDGRPTATSESVTISNGSTVHAEFSSYSGMRTAGWIFLIAGPIAGIALMVTSFSTNTCAPGDYACEPATIRTGQILAGSAVTLVSMGLGFAFILKKDEASVRVSGGPIALRLPSRSFEAAGRGPFGGVVPGLGISCSF